MRYRQNLYSIICVAFPIVLMEITTLISFQPHFKKYIPILGSEADKNSSQAPRSVSADELFNVAIQQFKKGQFIEAEETLKQVLKIRQSLNEQTGIADTLNLLGQVYTNLGNYQQADKVLQQALEIYQVLNSKKSQGKVINNIGVVYHRLGDYLQARELHQQALEIAEETNNSSELAESYHNLGAVEAGLGNYTLAIELYQKALNFRQKNDDQFDLGRTLNNIGGVYFSLGDYSQALTYYQQALKIARRIGNRASEARILNNLGLIDFQAGEYLQSKSYYEQALSLVKQTEDRRLLSQILNNLGAVHEQQDKYSEALELYQQSLSVSEEINDSLVQGRTLNNIGGIYYLTGRYFEASEYYQKALDIRQKSGSLSEVADSQFSLAGLYFDLGQYQQAKNYLNQALDIYRKTGEIAGKMKVIRSLGMVEERLNNYPQALAFLQEALQLAKQIGDQSSWAENLNLMGRYYTQIGDYSQALETQNKALGKIREIGNKASESQILNSIARIYSEQQNNSQALDYLQQALSIAIEIGDYSGTATIQSNIAQLFTQQNQLNLAIAFYKKSINTTQSIRENIQKLSIEQQQSFTDKVTDRYRILADLLLQKNRILEAQEVIDLLKLQELEDSRYQVRSPENSSLLIGLLPREKQLLERYGDYQNQAVQLGRELEKLRTIPTEQLTPQQIGKLQDLMEIQARLRQEFNNFVQSSEVTQRTQDLNRTTDRQNLTLQNLSRLQRSLKQIKPSAVLLYPIVFKDRLELILITPYSPPLRRTVSVDQETLRKETFAFRSQIMARYSSIPQLQKTSKNLYKWLIEPIENDLIQAKAETIIYATDSWLRYIPLAALYDGEQWFIERFNVNRITASSLTNFIPNPLSELRVLAGAFTEGKHQVKIGDYARFFRGLQYAKVEVENLASAIPETITLLDRSFSREAVKIRLNRHNIIHLATHAKFFPQIPQESFILFGNGDRITLQDLQTWNLTNVDLVVLSACETGVSQVLENGEEILGLGYQMQQAGALATIASLWQVNDRGTQILMNTFYQELLQSKTSPIQALRQAQMTLLNTNYEHPYFWASFILIGNGF